MNNLLIATAAFVVVSFAAAAQAGGYKHQSQTQQQQTQPQQTQQQSEPIDPGAPHSGEPVKKAQEVLNDQGFNAGAPDGVIDEQTKSAVRDFQKMSGIQPTGQLDPQTLAALGVSPSDGSGS